MVAQEVFAGPRALWRRRPRPGRWLKSILPRTLFGRSLLIIATPVVLAQAIATFNFYDRHWEELTKRLAFGVAGDIAQVIEQLDRDPDAAARAATVAMTERNMDLTFTWLAGERLPAGRQQLRGILEHTLARALDERVARPWLIDTNVAHKWVEIRVEMPDGVYSILSPERRLFSITNYLFLAVMLGSSLVLFAIAIVFMRNQIRPIRRLAFAADAFGKGRDVANFKPEGAAEVRQAAAAFLTMRERIRRMIDQRTEMLAGVSHDLRTPLTRMKLQLAMLPDAPEVEELKADVLDMEVMIEGYLAFARGEEAEPPQPVDLPQLLESVAGNARREGGDVRIATDESPDAPPAGGPAPPLLLTLRPNAMRRCLANLVANALRYGRRVRLSLYRGAAVVEILVDDDGPGIPAAQREAVFRPFHRLDPSRNPETGGVGLGLTIARDVARRHGGDVLLADSPLGGLRAIVRLPM